MSGAVGTAVAVQTPSASSLRHLEAGVVARDTFHDAKGSAASCLLFHVHECHMYMYSCYSLCQRSTNCHKHCTTRATAHETAHEQKASIRHSPRSSPLYKEFWRASALPNVWYRRRLRSADAVS